MESPIFGPVPSRRLGKSIGVNSIPYKVCSYSCAYCQIGKGVKMQVDRQEFYPVDLLVRGMEQKLNSLNSNDYPDYLSIVPDGEPTLDIHLGELILKLKAFNIPIAVITNSSLISDKRVQNELMNADYLSIKVDTVDHTIWKRINKPHKDLNLDSILSAIQDFSKVFDGKLVTESMLLKDMNDSETGLMKLGEYLQTLNPCKAFIAIPTRPVACENIFPADEAAVALAYEVFTCRGLSVELLTGYEGNAFASSGNFTDDILSITAVHPMRKDAVHELMAKSNASNESLNNLIECKLIKVITYNNQIFFIRCYGH
ncbi:MAG TPA: radical SAM protein [Bacteroidales bacterium]|nr:radical SAM protein [Bacteroidales bacterium]